MHDRFDPSDAATWIARGRSPEHAEALAQAWRDFPDLPPTAALEDRMARTRARVIAMRPVNDAIQLASEAERQRRNFLHVEGKAASGSIGDSDLAILRGRDAYGYDWDTAVCYSRGWYAAHAGWNHGGPDISSRLPAHRAAYDRGFTDGGGDTDDLFDAARRRNVAAERTGNQPRPLAPAIAARPLPSSWPKPSDEPRPVHWTRRLLILADDPALGNGPTAALVDQIRARPEAEGLNIIVLSAADGFCATITPDAPPLTTGRCKALARDPQQTARLRTLIADMTIDDILIAAPDNAMAVVDAHAAALPLCRTMERTRNTVLQQRAHLRTWLDRATTGDGNVGAGHIRWSKLAKGLSGKLGEFSVRYAGKAQDNPGHIIVVETSGTPALGFVTADGRPLNPHITFGNKSRMRQEMATALRAFGGATRLAPTLFATAA